MIAFRDVSVKNKLRIIILLISGGVLFLASSLFVVDEITAFRRTMVADLFALADFIGVGNAEYITIIDIAADSEEVIEKNMAALEVKVHVISAHVFVENKVVASYFRDEKDRQLPLPIIEEPPDPIPSPRGEVPDKRIEGNAIFHDHFVEVVRHIIFEGQNIGSVYIQSDLKELDKRLFNYIITVITILSASLFLAFVLASRLQRIITAPIDNLLKTMEIVSVEKNYALRQEKHADDELGKLIDGFNKMLAQIEIRNEELKEYHEHLEEKVVQRTSELAEARDQALAANKAKSAFLANMSHEIRTPMNAILGYAQILQRDSTLTKDQRNTLHIIEDSGNHLLSLINDILDISKIEAGAMELRLENFYLNDLVDSVVSMFKMRCQQKGLEWYLENTVLERILLYADQVKLRQILINLLGNAVKFTEKGSITLRVSDQSDDHYRFDVIDTGRGIPVEATENIFEPFQQEREGFDKGGTGLGLAITRRQVELMKGTVSVTSEIGKGSRFTVVLPLPTGSGTAITFQRDQSEVSRLAEGFHVYALVVDDVKENRDILSQMLKNAGVDVREAKNGLEALEEIKNQRPDIVFSDIRMPVMGGIEFIQNIRQNEFTKHLPCTAITASSLRHENQKVLSAGFDDFISKPFHFQEIYDCLMKFLNVKFDYEENEESDFEEIDEEFDFSTVSITKDLYDRFQESAELSELTELEELLAELRTGNEQHEMMADIFQGFLNNYDTDSILDALEKVNYE